MVEKGSEVKKYQNDTSRNAMEAHYLDLVEGHEKL